MALRKPEPTDSIGDARASADVLTAGAAAPGRATREYDFSAELFDSEPRIRDFNLHLMRTGAALLVAFEAIYFIVAYFSPNLTPAAVAMHVAMMVVTTVVGAFTMTSSFERNGQSALPTCWPSTVLP
jgi:hypothetical protein